MAGDCLAALQTKSFTTFCALAAPGQGAKCTSDTASAGTLVTFQHVAIGTVDVVGDKAVVTLTGTICQVGQSPSTQGTQGSQCQTNSTPNAVTRNRQTFVQGFANADDPASRNGSPFVTALVQQDGRWYASGF